MDLWTPTQPTNPPFTRALPEASYNYSVLSGGTGGQGGPSKNKGGGGGLGEAPQISAAEARRYNEINGGVGGQGGEGGVEGGMGGVGQGPRFAKMLVVVDGKTAARVPHLTIAKFCKQFQLSEKIWWLLQEEGYETAGRSRSSVGLEAGQIAEVQRGLKEFLAKAQP
ncbi:hypothetical protein B0H14DRAFT_2715794 [Mycena olivaceomarginata]|nr:hypothetical protein B0H14DRAFT_2715794 [Mycena olivaceomarginata]